MTVTVSLREAAHESGPATAPLSYSHTLNIQQPAVKLEINGSPGGWIGKWHLPLHLRRLSLCITKPFRYQEMVWGLGTGMIAKLAGMLLHFGWISYSWWRSKNKNYRGPILSAKINIHDSWYWKMSVMGKCDLALIVNNNSLLIFTTVDDVIKLCQWKRQG